MGESKGGEVLMAIEGPWEGKTKRVIRQLQRRFGLLPAWVREKERKK